MLSPEQYNILRNKGTEYPGTGEYNKLYPKDGHFACAGCGQPLYSAASKFDSGCGWPAFDKIVTGAVVTDTDRTLGMTRVEIMCSGCGGHLGHVFEGEGFTPTNERHCVNSGSVKYVAQPLPAEAIEDKVLPGPGGADSKSDLMQGLSALFNKKSE
jgi:peptide-methionine (R)-S-oxide reductase